MKLNRLLTIIIVHWNTPKQLHKLIAQLNNTGCTVHIIDNSSSLSSDKVTRGKKIRIHKNILNKGYSSACNQGLINARTPWVLFLNPDVVISVDSIKKMIDQARKMGLHACSPNPENAAYRKPLHSTMSLLFEFTPLHRIAHLIPKMNHQETLFGGALLVKTKIAKELMGWDERFFLWFEDVDFTKRLLEEGHKVGWIDVHMSHIGGASFSKLRNDIKREVFFHSMDIYIRKHLSMLGRAFLICVKKKYLKNKITPAFHDDLSLIVPNMRLEILKDFLKKNRQVLSELHEVICVSSGLNKVNIWQLRKQYPNIIFIPLRVNEGFSITVNIGIRRSTGRFVATANDDTTLNNDFFKTAANYMKAKVGSINPIIIKSDGSIESGGIKILHKGKAHPLRNIPKKTVYEVDATNAACVIYSREALSRIGLFDEKFGSYLEDIDISLRLSKAGYKNIVINGSPIIHQGHMTSKTMTIKKSYYDFKNWILIILKHWSIERMLTNAGGICIERIRNLNGLIKASLQR